MKYLSYQPARRQPWVEHDDFPHKAVKYWRGQVGKRCYRVPEMIIYRVSDDRKIVELVED